jgi:hypothetical protein
MDNFTSAYIECALWSSTAYGVPEDDGEGHFDTSMERYGLTKEDLAPETLANMVADCHHFLETFGHLIDDTERAGHDFWLTRNRHGAGFWDGRWPEPAATQLTEAAQAYGEVDLYVGDDGKIYGS